jgi:hypothetical protein
MTCAGIPRQLFDYVETIKNDQFDIVIELATKAAEEQARENAKQLKLLPGEPSEDEEEDESDEDAENDTEEDSGEEDKAAPLASKRAMEVVK